STISTAPVRTMRRCSTGSAPWRMIVSPAGGNSSSAAATTRSSSPGASAADGGCSWRKRGASGTGGAGMAGPGSPAPRRGRSVLHAALRVLLEHVGALLADHHRRDTRVDRWEERQDRAVRDAQGAYAADAQARVDDRERVGVRAHVTAARRVIDRVMGL